MSSQIANEITTSSYEALRVPLLGWYLDGQDIRIPHFLATHMMQLLPLYGLWLNKQRQAVGSVYEARLIWTTSILGLATLVLFLLAVY
jgi:hypothetical protein